MDSVQHRHHLLTAWFSCGPPSWMLLTNSCPFSANRKLHLFFFENKTVFLLEANWNERDKVGEATIITVAIDRSFLTTDQVKRAVTVLFVLCPSFLNLFFHKGKPKSFHMLNLKLYVASAVSQFLSRCSPSQWVKKSTTSGEELFFFFFVSASGDHRDMMMTQCTTGRNVKLAPLFHS